jgi:hypothetical protein
MDTFKIGLSIDNKQLELLYLGPDGSNQRTVEDIRILKEIEQKIKPNQGSIL